MQGYKKQRIQLDFGDSKKPVMGWVKGFFGLHKEGNYYTVTHIPTGKGLFRFNSEWMPGCTTTKSEESALRLVALLEELELSKELDASHLTQIQYRVTMVRFDMTLDQAVIKMAEMQERIDNASRKLEALRSLDVA